MKKLISTGVFAALALLIATAPAQAQGPYKNVISANPFGLLLEVFNAEYERVIGESSTVGIGGSTFSSESDSDGDGTDDTDLRYLNADAFYRFYPSGEPLNGWMFGIKVGVTSITDEGTYAGFGFDVNRSWLLGKRDNFYVGVGFGLKRLLGVDDNDDEFADDLLEYIPTFRIINVGFAF